MALVYIKKINDDEYIGIEKLTNSNVQRSFTFKKENFDAVCKMLIDTGHNYSYIEENKFGERRHVRSSTNLSKRILLYSFLIGCIVSIPMLILELLINFDSSYILWGIGYLMLRIVIIAVLGSIAMFRSDTRPIQNDLNWRRHIKYQHYPIFNSKTYFLKTKPFLTPYELGCVIGHFMTVLLMPLYIITMKTLSYDHGLNNVLVFSMISVLLSFGASFANVYGLGMKSVVLSNQYERIPMIYVE